MDKNLATNRKPKLIKSPMSLPVLNLVLLAAMIFVMTLPGKESGTATGFYLDTVVSVSVYGKSSEKKAKDLATQALNQCKEYEQLFSRTIEGSDIWNINHAKGAAVSVSPLTVELLSDALEFAQLTDGTLDPTVLSLDNVWDISKRIKNPDFNQPLPDSTQIADALKLVDYTAIEIIDDHTVFIKNPEIGIDLGAIAKGFIADKLKEFLVSKGVKNGLINLGGNIVIWGKNEKKENFTIGVQSPFSENGEYVCTVAFLDIDHSIVTSGTYERYFTYGGKDYTHIFDTKTGYPISSDLVSATVLAKDSYVADALSTACLIMGLEKGLAFIEGYDGVEAIFITDTGEIIYSSFKGFFGAEGVSIREGGKKVIGWY